MEWVVIRIRKSTKDKLDEHKENLRETFIKENKQRFDTELRATYDLVIQRYQKYWDRG